MSKKVIQDILKNSKNSEYKKEVFLDDFSKKSEKIKFIKKDNEFKKRYNIVKNTEGTEKEKQSPSLWFVAICAVIFLFFALSFIFSSATISINPKIEDFNLNQNFLGIKNSNIESDLPFDLIMLSGESSKEVTAGEEKDYLDKSKGVAVIYNSFSETSQAFPVNTKLEGSNGKIYKIDSKVIVPGKESYDLPGSVEVEFTALDAGEEYNSPPLDFKILSLKGTSKYLTIYARSKGDIVGGLKGKSRQVNEEEKTKAIDELNNVLKEKLFDKAINQIPSGYILFKDSVLLKINGENIGQVSTDGKANFTINGTLYGFVFNEEKITKKIVESVVSDFDNSEVYIPNIKTLSFSLENKDSIVSTDVNSISFNLSGKPLVVWRVDAEKLLIDFLGKKKKEFNQVLKKYSNISSAEFSLNPVWSSTFPDKSKDIKIIINYPD